MKIPKEKYRCSKCDKVKLRRFFDEHGPKQDRKRDVYAWCKTCRAINRKQQRNSYGKRKYTTACTKCGWFGKVDGKDGECKICNSLKGLKICNACNAALSIIMGFFYKNRSVCKECYSTRRKAPTSP